MSDPIRSERRDSVQLLALSRPDVMNALDTETLQSLEAHAAEVAADPAVRAVVITGEGRAFCAGADIEAMRAFTPLDAEGFSRLGHRAFAGLEELSIPTLAAVNGFAFGGGCELAMACHLRVASSSAIFGQPEVKLGLIPGYAGTQRLPRLVGRGRALEILLTGRNVDAEEAERIGLVTAVCEPEELANTVDSLLRKVLANGPLAVAHCIEAVNHGLDLPFDDACLLEATLFGVGAASEEMREGTSAFLEKRKAQFRT